MHKHTKPRLRRGAAHIWENSNVEDRPTAPKRGEVRDRRSTDMCKQALNCATCGGADCIATIVLLGTFLLTIAIFGMSIYISANIDDTCLSKDDIVEWVQHHVRKSVAEEIQAKAAGYDTWMPQAMRDDRDPQSWPKRLPRSGAVE